MLLFIELYCFFNLTLNLKQRKIIQISLFVSDWITLDRMGAGGLEVGTLGIDK